MSKPRIEAEPVAAGQVWQNVRNNCRLTVQCVREDGKAVCTDQRGRQLVLAASKFRPTSRGYRLVGPTPAADAATPDD